jgi:hypothetical protein
VAETVRQENALIAIADISQIELISINSVKGTHGIRHVADASFLANLEETLMQWISIQMDHSMLEYGRSIRYIFFYLDELEDV